jgi:putative NADPH-quinone reductase
VLQNLSGPEGSSRGNAALYLALIYFIQKESHMTRVYAVLAHPKGKDSLNGHIFYAIVEQLKKQNIEVDVLDLYQQAHRIPFFSYDAVHTDFFKENKQRFMAADRLVVVYPVYWYSVPGILKCWLDLITNFAWKYEKFPHAKPLHHITKAMVINSAGIPNWYRWLCTKNSASETLKQSFKFIGLPKTYFYEIGNAGKLKPEQIQKHVNTILQKTQWLIEP